MNILGISAFYHDSAACLVRDGEIISAAEEERFTRKKHDSGFPEQAINFCLSYANLHIKDVDYLAFYEKPFLKFERLIETYLAYAPSGLRSFLTSIPIWMKEKLFLKKLIKKKLNYEGKILFAEHHESHAASAFYPSSFQRAAFFTIDAVGERMTTSFGTGCDNNLTIWQELNFPHSLGLLYSAFTYFTGFKVNSDEYKVMGLAPYGEPNYVNLILDELVDLKKDGSFRLNMKYFNYCTGFTMTNQWFERLFRKKPRQPETKITQEDMDLACSIQAVAEEIIFRMAKYVHKATKMKNLCLGGGVALNCVANGKLLKKGPFENIWIQPAASDAGGSLGAALTIWYKHLKNKRVVGKLKDFQKGSYLGPKYNNEEIKAYLDQNNISYKMLTKKKMLDALSKLIIQGKIIGWFQGRMEFGPRALGSRSILADARFPQMQSILNQKIKFRESFRPFAPSVLKEKASEYFDLKKESPYMLFVDNVKKHSNIPAVTHVDGTARIQTVDRKDNELYYDLINTFYKKTDCPIVINTSFNVRGEPIVCSFKDAYKCFMKTGIDCLAMGNFLLLKEDQVKIDMTVFLISSLLNGKIKIIYPVYWLAVRLGSIVGKISTVVVLFFIFYLIVLPTGLIMKLLKKDILELKIDKNVNSYWKKRNRIINLFHYERQS